METPQEAVLLTDKAAGKIKDLLASNGNADEQALRVAVRGGGCSGFQYALALDQPDDDSPTELLFTENNTNAARLFGSPNESPHVKDAIHERVVNGVLAHAYEEYRTDRMSKAVVNADAVAGLLVAAALVRPERSAGMKVSSVKKKLRERSFAPGVNRDEVTGVEASLGLPLDEFLAVSIEGLQEVAPEIDL